MRRRVVIVGLVLLAAGGLLLAGDEPEPARAAGGAASGWTWYTWWQENPEIKTGAKVGHARIPWFGFDLGVSAIRTTGASGTEQGSRRCSGWGIAGLKVLNPVVAYQYSWMARCKLEQAVLRAKITLGDRGKVCGRAEGSAQINVLGDLRMRSQRDVAARDFRGGHWNIGWPPVYEPPFSADPIQYSRAEDAAGLVGWAQQFSPGQRVEVRGQARVFGEVMAYCQPGLDPRSALARVTLDDGAEISLKGYTAVPTGNGEPIPMIGVELRITWGLLITPPCDIEGEDLSPWIDEDGEQHGDEDPPAPPEGREDDFRFEEW